MTDVVLLYGALRSGTTMLRLMLGGHPALSCPGESDFLFDHLRPDEAGWCYDRAALQANRIYRASPMELPADVDGEVALSRMIDQARRGTAARPVLVLHRHAERALALLPEAKVIHLVRDPRDVARSAIGMGWAGNVYHGAWPWLAAEDGWTAATEGRRVDVHEVRYEDLVTAPEATLEELCAFLALPFDAGMLAYDAHSTYDRPDPGLTYQWRRKLAPRQIRQVEARLGPRLAAAGYAPSGLAPLRLSAPERLWLRAQNAAATRLHRIRRYGAPTILQRKLARILGLQSLEARAQARMDRITIRHLK